MSVGLGNRFTSAGISPVSRIDRPAYIPQAGGAVSLSAGLVKSQVLARYDRWLRRSARPPRRPSVSRVSRISRILARARSISILVAAHRSMGSRSVAMRSRPSSCASPTSAMPPADSR